MFCAPLMKLCYFKEKNINFEHIITYFLVEKIRGPQLRGGHNSRQYGNAQSYDLHYIFGISNLSEHMYAAHGMIMEPKIKILACPKCDFTTLNIGRYKGHLETHNQKRE